MAKNWAIVVGINQYEFLQPLNYAKRDAELMAQFLGSEAGFEQVFLFSDSSPEFGGKSTRPFRANLLRLFREIFETPFMGDGDNFWFFFAGHGIRHADRDYLMPLDGDPHDIENTGIPTNFLTERLRRCGADNVVMLLDACRNTGSRAGQGIGTQTAEEARQTGVISIFACSPNQFSHEVESLQQGAFTYALLEGLGIRGRCATVERLNQYLEYRVPEILREYLLNVRQTPYTIAEPIERSHLILMPRYASLTEIAVLKNDAYQTEINQNWELAERLWIRIIAAASGQDVDALRALQRIALEKEKSAFLRSQAEHSTQQTRRKTQPSALPKQTRGGNKTRKPMVSPSQPQSALTLPDDDLSSDKGIDYWRLRDLLKSERWREADEETLSVMLQVAGLESRGFLTVDSIRQFSQVDLRTINSLWLKYSNYRFGFSIQRQIWVSIGEEGSAYNHEVWMAFSRIVGWTQAARGDSTQPSHYSENDRSLNVQQLRKSQEFMKWLEIRRQQEGWSDFEKEEKIIRERLWENEKYSESSRLYDWWIGRNNSWEQSQFEKWLIIEEKCIEERHEKLQPCTSKSLVSSILAYDELNFSTSAPGGHLPAKCFGVNSLGVWGIGWSGWSILLRQDLRA